MCLHRVYFCRTLPYHMVICACVLRNFKRKLKKTLALHTRHLHTLLELLLNIKEPRDLNYIQSIVFLHIVAWHMSVLSLAQCLRLQCRMLRHYQKRISTSNFETSSHQNVTAKKPIGNIISCMLTWPDFIAYRD